ncbi:Glycosylphosphatidylinositol:protein transamidase, GAA1 component [Aulographum hederae CBS 113979]|uniref:Glycosylphosphatidylinositol:protein transamidase, GAA1 component n=1 Tax=Aulographum hederae CBS 113979 TaxID=1176131 RepID=A0A6G1H3G4_9PEZI|nr:Glycosylphosphatidylinositol:protein transamidase, GAA1 component [Aulographum hederae CBS 113979]
MSAFTRALLAARRNPNILRIPPYLSALCIIVGVVWLLLLPLNEYSRQTYVSENALLPGQVHTYFGGSEHNIFRAHRHEVFGLRESSMEERNQRLEEIFKDAGLKVARQKYEYTAAGKTISGENVYAILQGPRADATEAVVMIGAWKNMDDVINYSGVALVLTLARYFKRWSLWSKDIIFLIPPDSTLGPTAWVSAYHSTNPFPNISPLPLKSGALQAAIAIDYPAGPWGHRFDKLHVLYDGANGALPNLDLFNTAVSIASGQMGLGCTLQRMWKHNDSYQDRLVTMLRGMVQQGLGHVSGPHSSFIPYHVDAITLQTVGDGWHDEMTLGRVMESLFRSLNNLLEHLHQSFFFYLLMQANRFVSIGTYLPSAMLLAVNFSITAIVLWVQSGRPAKRNDLTSPLKGKKTIASSSSSKEKGKEAGNENDEGEEKEDEMTLIVKSGDLALVPTSTFKIVERNMFLPIALLSILHFLGLMPLYILNHTPESSLPTTTAVLLISTLALPPLTTSLLLSTPLHAQLTPRTLSLIQSLSLLLLSTSLSTLATLNFSLSLLLGLLSAPLSFIRPISSRSSPKLLLSVTLLVLTAPPVVLVVVCALVDGTWQRGWSKVVGKVVEILVRASWGWHVSGLWTQVVVWLVWWPAWWIGGVVLGCGLFVKDEREMDKVVGKRK